MKKTVTVFVLLAALLMPMFSQAQKSETPKNDFGIMDTVSFVCNGNAQGRVKENTNSTFVLITLCDTSLVFERDSVYSFRLYPNAHCFLSHLYVADTTGVMVDRVADVQLVQAANNAPMNAEGPQSVAATTYLLFSDTIHCNLTVTAVFDSLPTYPVTFSSNNLADGKLTVGFNNVVDYSTNPVDTTFMVDSTSILQMAISTLTSSHCFLKQLNINGAPFVLEGDTIVGIDPLPMILYGHNVMVTAPTHVEAVFAYDSIDVLFASNDTVLGGTNPTLGYHKVALHDTLVCTPAPNGYAKFTNWYFYKKSVEDVYRTSTESTLSLVIDDTLFSGIYGDTLVIAANFVAPDSAYYTIQNEFEALGHAFLNYANGEVVAVPEGASFPLTIDSLANGVLSAGFEYWEDAPSASHFVDDTATVYMMTSESYKLNQHFVVKGLFDYQHFVVTVGVADGCANLGTADVKHFDGTEITEENPVTILNPLVKYTATATDSSQFAYWDNGVSNWNGNPLTVRVESDTNLLANFIIKLAFEPIDGNVEEYFEVQSDGLCQGDSGFFKFNVAAGAADQYMIEFPNQSYTTVDWTDLENNTFSFTVPADASNGLEVGKVKFRTRTITAHGDTVYVESDFIYFNFIVNLEKAYIHEVFYDVLAVDNRFGDFNTYQWYRNGEPIEGATKGYFQEVGGLKGDVYYVRVNMNTLDAARTCEYKASVSNVKARNMYVYPSPVTSNTTIRLSGFEEGEHLMRVFNAYGVEVMSQRFSGVELNVNFSTLPMGNYMVNVDGESVKVMKY